MQLSPKCLLVLAHVKKELLAAQAVPADPPPVVVAGITLPELPKVDVKVKHTPIPSQQRMRHARQSAATRFSRYRWQCGVVR